MVVIEGKQKEAAATEEVVSKAASKEMVDGTDMIRKTTKKMGISCLINGGYFVAVKVIVFLF